MKDKLKEQAAKELNQHELDKVSGGVLPGPIKPDDDGHDSGDDNGGGATGGW